MNKFLEVYHLIVNNGNYIQPMLLRMDNQGSNRYEYGEWFTGIMADIRWVGKHDSNGNVLWRVNNYYPNHLEYSGITENEFNAITK